MVFKTRFYATAALVAVLGLAPFASASAQTSPSTTTTIFPPQNQAAGGGLLYFPQGGPGSLFAVPVLSDATLDAATQAEGTQLAAINATLQQINATLAALAKAQGTTGTSSRNFSTVLFGFIILFEFIVFNKFWHVFAIPIDDNVWG